MRSENNFMAKTKEEWSLLKIVCMVVAFCLITSIVRFGLGYDGILVSAVTGAAGALVGALVYEMIMKARG